MKQALKVMAAWFAASIEMLVVTVALIIAFALCILLFPFLYDPSDKGEDLYGIF
jgi:hypothetical protein